MIASLRALERFLLPNACVACETPVSPREPDALVCGLCLHRMRRLSAGCGRCQQPLPPVGPCRFCRAWPGVLGRVRSAVWLDECAREILHHLKYDGYAALGEIVAEVIVRSVRRPPAAVLVPVPLSRRRYRARGYNQAAVLAAAVARRWQLPLAAHLLTRVRETRSQTTLSPDDRVKNVRGAFTARSRPAPWEGGEQREAWERGDGSLPGAAASAPSPGEGWAGAEIILLDDVLTTGATIAAAAEALAASGWSAVGAVTFARARPFAQRVVLEWNSTQQLTQRG